MKKLIVLSIALLAAMALALPANAAVDWEQNASDAVVTLGSGSAGNRPQATYGLSSNVYLYYATDTDHMNYVLGSAHKSGNRGFATANSTTLIYYQSKAAGDTSVTISETPASDCTFSTGTWTAL
jgi:hypothetical protein